MKKYLKKFAGIKLMTTFASANEKQRFFNKTSGSIRGCFFNEELRALKKNAKKVLEKFGGLKKLHYLCTTFRSEKEREVFQTVL